VSVLQVYDSEEVIRVLALPVDLGALIAQELRALHMPMPLAEVVDPDAGWKGYVPCPSPS
jgi:hypothetical protein